MDTNERTTLTSKDVSNKLRIVQFHGDLDSVGTRMIDEQFTAATGDRTGHLIVDLADVQFISSAGLAMLLVKGKMLSRSGGKLSVAGASKRVAEVLSMAGFHELFEIYPTVEAAVAARESA